MKNLRRDQISNFSIILSLSFFTGMRSGEMYALQWRDIDLETELISVNKQWISKDGLHFTKSNKNRIVPISPELKLLLMELKLKGSYKETVEARAGENARKQVIEDLVLPRLNEWKYGQQALVLEDFCRGIGVTEVKFHDLRATFITNLLAQGVPLVQVMSIVGHSKMSTTDEYLRLAGVNVKGATEKLGYKMPRQKSKKIYQLFPNGSKS